MRHSPEDRAVVEAQLDRPVRGSWGVAARCHLGVPTVIESHPLMEDGSPFPTTFWLTCPILVKRASKLEANGAMRAMTETLERDDALRDRLGDAIDRYRARRDAHLVIKESGGPPGGGPDRVKCLHAHLAHELAAPPNPIGARTLAMTEWPDCVEPCVVVERRAAASGGAQSRSAAASDGAQSRSAAASDGAQSK